MSEGGGAASRHERAERLFERARSLPREELAVFLDGACGADRDLRDELASLVEHAEAAEEFFAHLAPAVVPPELTAPLTLGRYRVVNCIAVGGMGAVYRARDIVLDRDVALKFLPLCMDAAEDAAARLLREARAAAALEHPNVCTVHDIGAGADGRPYIAMAFYEGETLKERLRRGPVAVPEAIDIAVQAARGLGAAHARGIVHRDVKPGNIMLAPDGTVKLLDFGLARLAEGGPTRPGITPGTPVYMSPEQVRGDGVGPRSDLWSLGVVLHEMIVGVPPFRGGNDRVVVNAILHARPEPARRGAPGLSPALERVLDRLLAKDPAARPGSAEELITDLVRARAAPTGAPMIRSAWHPVPSGRARTVAAVLVPGILLAGAALLSGDPVALSADPPAAGATAVASSKTIAVLPFTNLSADPAEDYFSDGLTDELIGALSRVRTLRVAARTSAFAFKDESRDIRDIGRALSVGTVVEGSVRRDGDRIRVAVQLINVADGMNLWSATYERDDTGIFAIQQDLALDIAGALQAELTAEERARIRRPPTASAEAFTHYLKGRHFWNQRTPDGFQRAIEYFHRAIAADAAYAEAYAGLAAVYSLQGLSGTIPRDQARVLMRDLLYRALELDPASADAHAVFGAFLHAYEWDVAGAERQFVRAIELNPNHPAARHFYGNLLGAHRRLDEAIAQKTRAVELDPLAPALSESLAFTLLRAGRPDEALERVNDALELDPTYWRAHAVLGNIHEVGGRFDEAIAAYERAKELANATTHRMRADIARVLARRGREAEARRLIRVLQAEATATGMHEPSVATALFAAGDADAAFAWLEAAYREMHPALPFVGGDPRYTVLDGDARFADLLRRISP